MSLFLSFPAAAQAQGTTQERFVKALDRMMVELAPQSARASKTIRQAYREHLDLLVLNEYADLEGALFNGGLARLPSDPLRFNLAPRVAGPFPIGEKDLANQVSYIAARPATIGALFDIASRVKSGPLEVTSLVRHSEYQGALRSTNRNATTSVPMHTMGLAFDIALVNTPLDTVYEIRDVLLRMQKAGEILFIGERKQLVFHVVPHPSRLGHFTDLYVQAVGTVPATNSAHVVAFSRSGKRDVKRRFAPTVSAEVVAVVPAVGFGEEWWAANHEHADLTIEVVGESAAAPGEMETAVPSPQRPPAGPFVTVFALLALAFAAATQRRSTPATVLNPLSNF